MNTQDGDRDWTLARIERLRDLLSGSAGDVASHLSVPEAGRRYAVGSTVPLLGTGYVSRPSGLLVPEGVAQGPAPIDLLQVYATFEEVFGTDRPTLHAIDETLSTLTLEGVLYACSQVVVRLEAAEKDWSGVSQDLANGLEASAAQRARNLINSGRVLVVPQAAMVTMKRALKVCRRGPWDGSYPNPVPLLLAIQSTLAAERSAAPSQTLIGMHPGSDGNLMAEILRNQTFNSTSVETLTLASFQRRWRELPSELRLHPEYVDLESSFAEATGTSLDDFVTVALALWAAVQRSSNPLLTIEWFASLSWGSERLAAALAPMTCDMTTLAERFEEQDIRLGEEWAFDALRRFPIIRIDKNRLLVTSLDLLIERAFGWTLRFDLTAFDRARTPKQQRAVNFLRQVTEAEIHECLQRIAPDIPGERRAWSGEEIRGAFGAGPRLADAVLEYDDAWIVLEISTRQLRREVVIGGGLSELEEDLKTGIIQKAQQLEKTIELLGSNEERLTGRPSRPRRLYVPVLVITEGFPLNPVVSTAINALLEDHSLLRGPRVGPLRILDREDLFAIEGGTAYGTSLLDYLESYENSPLRQMPFSAWLFNERGESHPIPERLRELAGRAFEVPLDALRDGLAPETPEE